MKTLILFLLTHIIFQVTYGQEKKIPIYANVALGYGNTFFYGSLSEKETINDDRGFGRNQGSTLSTFFYAAPEKWNGLGIGSGIKGFTASPNQGGDNETYFFNYYHVGLGLKYYPFSKQFNKGFNVKTNVGFGQMTEKTRFNNTLTYEHQFAIGTTLLGGFGYSIPFGKEKKASFNIDFEAEYSNRRGDVSGIGEDQSFQNSHVSINFGIGF